VGLYSGPVARRGPDNGRIHRDNRRREVCATRGVIRLPGYGIDKHNSRDYASGSQWNPQTSPGSVPLWEDAP
jgi:hypothetical protein